MAGSGKASAVHITALVFFVLFVITSFTTYNFYSSSATETAAANKAKADADSANAALRRMDEQLQSLKRLIGHSVDEIGQEGQAGENTLLGAMQNDIQTYGGQVAQPTYSATIVKLRQDLDGMIAERNDLNRQLQEEHAKLLAIDAAKQSRVDEADRARQTAQGDLAGVSSNYEEKLRSLEGQIASLRSDFNEVQITLEEERDSRVKEVKGLRNEISNLTIINNQLRDKVDDATRVSFEVPDGVIRRVDNVTGLVWINLGHADGLPLRATFSVYDKNNEGVGRGPEDIKGSIEVTRIIDAHLAEARFLGEDIYRPFAPGDQIYSPLWTPGRVEQFAIVGEFDLDGDDADDRELLHRVIATAGGKISAEVDADGNFKGDPIDVDTKFLVIGEIPEVYSSDKPEEQEKFQRITDHAKRMREEARQHGVRVVPINDFLAYIGYRSKRRLFVPGSGSGYSLKAGAASTAVDEVIGERSSSGQVSGAFDRGSRLPQKESSGQTSFSGRGGY